MEASQSDGSRPWTWRRARLACERISSRLALPQSGALLLGGKRQRLGGANRSRVPISMTAGRCRVSPCATPGTPYIKTKRRRPGLDPGENIGRKEGSVLHRNDRAAQRLPLLGAARQSRLAPSSIRRVRAHPMHGPMTGTGHRTVRRIMAHSSHLPRGAIRASRADRAGGRESSRPP